jgi:hypothetical protein
MPHKAYIDGEFAIAGQKLARPVERIDKDGLGGCCPGKAIAGAGFFGQHRQPRKTARQRLHDDGLGLFVCEGDGAAVSLQPRGRSLGVKPHDGLAGDQGDAREFKRYAVHVRAKVHGFPIAKRASAPSVN